MSGPEHITDACCAACGEQFQIDDLVTSDYGDNLVHFSCGPDADEDVDGFETDPEESTGWNS